MLLRYTPPVLFLLALVLGGAVWALKTPPPRPVKAPQEATAALAAAQPSQAAPILDALRSDLSLHRKLVLMTADVAGLRGPARERVLAGGHDLHHQRRALVFQLDRALAALCQEPAQRRDPAAAALLDWIENDPEILELDRLAFRDPLRALQAGLIQDASPQGLELRTRINRDLLLVDRIEAQVEAEYREVYGGPGLAPRGGERERWNAYVAAVRKLLPPPAMLPPAPPKAPEGFREISGRELPDKVLVLSFDDGPHRVYTPEIRALLEGFKVPALFFEVGRNLGAVDGAGVVKLGGLSSLTGDLVKAGFIIGNHSYTHAQLNKETGGPLETEIGETDRILSAIPGAHSRLFRFPYGARTPVQLDAIAAHHLRSVLWNIDSLDWADPVPSSVADRVLRLVAEEKRGIILFHDIHDRAGKVLPQLVPRLRAMGYTFRGLDAEGELVSE